MMLKHISQNETEDNHNHGVIVVLEKKIVIIKSEATFQL